ncbi:Hypothetical predicted protein [Mytilus galloprovincialis]|uniref:Uncharacterized protein n=1 Tax=Mytilus galloprovincialis TaxID=29158 RepID=A0A8B6GJ49_MYTGA|nr:Hypothetical predicted protein [Mytilus galloprovincialis]
MKGERFTILVHPPTSECLQGRCCVSVANRDRVLMLKTSSKYNVAGPQNQHPRSTAESTRCSKNSILKQSPLSQPQEQVVLKENAAPVYTPPPPPTPSPLSKPQEQVVPKENVASVYAPPPPPTPSAPLTIIYENETSTTTPLQTTTDPMWSKGNMIPVRVAAKRPVREELHPVVWEEYKI